MTPSPALLTPSASLMSSLKLAKRSSRNLLASKLSRNRFAHFERLPPVTSQLRCPRYTATMRSQASSSINP